MSLTEAAEAVLQFLEALQGQPARHDDPLLLAAVRMLGRSHSALSLHSPTVCSKPHSIVQHPGMYAGRQQALSCRERGAA